MQEVADVLAEAKFNRYVTVEQRVQFIRLIANIPEFVSIVHPVRECRDPNGDEFLEVSLNRRADVIITPPPWRIIYMLSRAQFLENPDG